MSPLWVLLLSLAFVTIRAATPLPPPTTADDFTNQTYRLVTTTPDKVGTYSLLGPQAVMPQGAVIVAEVIYNESYDELGWDFIQVTANTTLLSDDDRGRKAYFAAGYAEGYVSAVRMGQVYIGNGLQVPQPTNVMEWIKVHIAYMDEEVNINVQAGYPSPFWTQIGNHLAQLNGMAEGYMRAVIEGNRVGALNQPNLTFIDIFVLNFDNELGDVYNAVGGSSIGKREYKKHRSPLTYKTIDLHCSALVKVTSDDIYFSHVTWGGYNTMVRQYKIYRFQSTVSMTSVAGTIASGDDWYVTSNDLSVQETTNEFYNDALLAYITPSSASEFLRAMVANFIATDGPSWVALYQYNNSGTYCNQWMVLDWKLYSPGDTGDALADNLLWVAEQIPGNVTSADVTSTLRATSYWGSYNIPYFPHIYNVSGFTGLYEEYGPMFSYKKYARPEIFKRNHSDVVDLTSMRALMRYNNWQHDELSWIPLCDECSPRGSAWLAISSRGDLAGTNGWVGPTNPSYAGMFAQSANGGIDAKIMSYAQLRQGAMGNVICGPTYDQQPVFDFDATFPGTRPPGSANLFAFPWTFFNEVNRTLQ